MNINNFTNRREKGSVHFVSQFYTRLKAGVNFKVNGMLVLTVLQVIWNQIPKKYLAKVISEQSGYFFNSMHNIDFKI